MRNEIDYICYEPWPGPDELPPIPPEEFSCTNFYTGKIKGNELPLYSSYTVYLDMKVLDEELLDWLQPGELVMARDIIGIDEDTYITEVAWEYATGTTRLNLESARGFHARRQA